MGFLGIPVSREDPGCSVTFPKGAMGFLEVFWDLCVAIPTSRQDLTGTPSRPESWDWPELMKNPKNSPNLPGIPENTQDPRKATKSQPNTGISSETYPTHRSPDNLAFDYIDYSWLVPLSRNDSNPNPCCCSRSMWAARTGCKFDFTWHWANRAMKLWYQSSSWSVWRTLA